jgi:[histone H3]-trimethyl-L-lysine4 demethylase
MPSRTLPTRTAHPRRARKLLRTAPALDLSTLKLNYDPVFEVPKEERPMGLQDAPTYWPNEKEWTDPLGYIQSIAEEGKKYGIVKVIRSYIVVTSTLLDTDIAVNRLFRPKDGGRNSVLIQK